MSQGTQVLLVAAAGIRVEPLSLFKLSAEADSKNHDELINYTVRVKVRARLKFSVSWELSFW